MKLTIECEPVVAREIVTALENHIVAYEHEDEELFAKLSEVAAELTKQLSGRWLS